MAVAENRTPLAHDLRDRPAYPLAEAAHYLKVPPATLRSWALGRTYPRGEGKGHFPALLELPSTHPPTLSFWNLVEAHVIRSLRTGHGISVKKLREAMQFAEDRLRIHRPLLSRELCTDAGRVFIEHYGHLINLSASGQLAMRRLLEGSLKRVEWDGHDFPIRLYPFLTEDGRGDDRLVVIDPRVSFGRPILARRGISTHAIVERIDAGESVAELAEDYDLREEEIETAVVYERAA